MQDKKNIWDKHNTYILLEYAPRQTTEVILMAVMGELVKIRKK